ncbi:pyridoxal phosphate-dependent transferase [Circinella umbellata]|nr:pyridoxal phosphate-dependent transferase [Circinella umbellata]
MYQADDDVIDLEVFMANMLGHEASLFCASGTQSNQIGLRTLLTQPPHSVLCDARAHIFVHECGGLSYHSQASVTPVIPKKGLYLTAEDVEANINKDTLTGAVTRVVALENTMNGTIMPFEEIKRIRAVCDKHGLYLHLDGARLWNASAATGVSMSEYGKLFDSISVCLSKGAGAPIGSIIASTKDRIRHARHLRKLMGGGWRQAGFLAKIARHCIETAVPTMPETHKLASRLATHLKALGIRLALPCETNMLFLDFAPTGLTAEDFAVELRKKNIKITATSGSTISRVVLHYQVTAEVIEQFIDVATNVVKSHGKPVTTAMETDVKENRNTTNSSIESLGAAYPSGKN